MHAHRLGRKVVLLSDRLPPSGYEHILTATETSHLLVSKESQSLVGEVFESEKNSQITVVPAPTLFVEDLRVEVADHDFTAENYVPFRLGNGDTTKDRSVCIHSSGTTTPLFEYV